MICVEQWRRAIGLFSGHSRGRSIVEQSTDNNDNETKGPWTNFNCRLSVCALACLCAFLFWCVTPKATVTVTMYTQPLVNKLALAGDVETNPGPTIEEQLSAMNCLLTSKFKELGADMANITSALQSLQDTVSEVKNTVGELKEQLRELEHRQETLQLDLDSAYEATCVLRDRVDYLDEKLESQEQYSRRENIILHGIKEGANEDYGDMRKKVVEILNNSVKTKHWEEADILRAHRLGRQNSTGKRPTIVRFVQFMDKLTVLRARQDLRQADVGVSNDHTPRQREQLNRLREKGQRGYFKNGRLVVAPLPPSAPNSTRDGDPAQTAAAPAPSRRIATAQRRT